MMNMVSLEKGKSQCSVLEPDLTLKCVIKDGKTDLKEDINHQRKEIFKLTTIRPRKPVDKKAVLAMMEVFYASPLF